MLHKITKLFHRRPTFSSSAMASSLCDIPLSSLEIVSHQRSRDLCVSTRLREALVEMRFKGIKMGCRDYDALITESMNQRSLRSGQRVHAHIIKTLYLPSIYLANRVIFMYVQCGRPDDARKMLDEMPVRTVVSWTTVISGFSRGPLFATSLELFSKMMQEGTLPNEFTLATSLAACADGGAGYTGRQLHAVALKQSLSAHVFVGSSLVDMYAKTGALAEAHQLFAEMPCQDIVSCTAIISGYAQQGMGKEAVFVFRQLLAEGMAPNSVTLAGVLSALAGLAAIDSGREVHGYAVRMALAPHPPMENTLIDMYGKSGSMLYARRVFDSMSQRTVSSWNAVISAHSRHGLAKEALSLFQSMVNQSVIPDQLTFLAVLSGCAHAGLVEEGVGLFHQAMGTYNCLPGMELYGCMVDLLGRAGKLEAALEIVKGMPVEPAPAVWGSLLGAARAHGDVRIAELAARMVLEADPGSSASYVGLGNVYAGEGRWRETIQVRKMMGRRRVPKEPGYSWNSSKAMSAHANKI
ncbi:putative pentatricopeptide repeat-containing protein At3g13770, mitochondrial [Wolffia australiana]